MRMLFISFSGLLHALSEERVREEDLAEGLFYFGCARAHAFRSSEENIDVQRIGPKKDLETARRIHELILSSIICGEKVGRVLWRAPNGGQTYEGLNELLKKHGYGPVWHSDDDPCINFGVLEERVKEAGLPLKVIYRYSA